jgi:hypothetical protein
MAYFAPYLGDERRVDEIDISVHCDVHIFEWLMEYIHQPAKPPVLDAGSVISVLISADFLQMKPLTKHCIEFLRGALAEVLRLPIDLSCVSDNLLGELALHLEADEIERLRDKKDKIASRLYTRKLEAHLADEANTLHRCPLRTLYRSALMSASECPLSASECPLSASEWLLVTIRWSSECPLSALFIRCAFCSRIFTSLL